MIPEMTAIINFQRTEAFYHYLFGFHNDDLLFDLLIVCAECSE